MKTRFYIILLVTVITVALPLFTAASPLAGIAISEASGPEAQVQGVLPDDLQWRPHPTIAGVQSAIALGNPSNSELYVLFGKMETGATFPAHIHPDNRITTVLSGMMYYGIGEQLDLAHVQPYPAGSVVYTPAGAPHFMWAGDRETVMQEVGFGPTGLTFTTDIN